MANPVQFFNTDIGDVTDMNRLSAFDEEAFETLLEAISQGKRNLLWGGVIPIVLSVTPPTVTVRVPAQYFAIEARSAFIAQTDIPVLHPAPGVAYDFYIYLMLRLEDISEVRINVNPVTFVQTPTARDTYRDEQTEFTVLNVISAGPAPVPPTGPGVPAPQYERLGYVQLARFTWDGVTAVPPAMLLNSADVVQVGSTGLPLHGATHATTDPMPYPTTVNRGAMPPASLPYLKNSISRVEAAAGEPFTIVSVGANGPAGDTNYTNPFVAGSSKGYTITLKRNASLNLFAGNLGVVYGGPTGGLPGVSLEAARKDHSHLILNALPTYKTHLSSIAYPGNASFKNVPGGNPGVPQSIVIDAARPNQIVQLQVDMTLGDNGAFQSRAIEISGGGGMKRLVLTETNGSGSDYVACSCMVMIQLDGAGAITVFGRYYDGAGVLQTQNGGLAGSSIFQYRISALGFFGQA